MTSDLLITLNNVTKRYGNRDVLTDVSLSISQGDFIVLRGNNGSGKSTLLKMVCGLISISSGQRLLKHSELVIGYAPDRLSELRMTSTEYLTHMGKISNIPKDILQERIKQLHGLFKLEQSKDVKMIHFSKGMLQKLNLMQAMIKTPHILVLDEPFSGLDKASIQHLLASLHKIKAAGTTILAAVHDPVILSEFEHRTYWIHKGKLELVSSEERLEQSTTFFELTSAYSKHVLEQLINKFPDVSWRKDGSGLMYFKIKKKDYRAFLIEFIHLDGEIVMLQRKEF